MAASTGDRDALKVPTDWHRWRRVAAIEAVPVVVVVFAAIIAVSHLVTTDWAATFFYNADSLVLPLIERSVEHGEPFHWVFSSQNFLFPEAPIFAVSTLFTNSARVALLTNACLNVVALYVLLRTIAHHLANRSRHRFVEIFISFVATLTFVIFVLLEQTAAVNGAGIATLFLFTSYYYGVIVIGLVVISLTLWVTRSFGPVQWGRRRSVIYVVSTGILTALTTFSDPLFILQVIAPLLACFVLLIFCNRLSWWGFALLSVPSIIGMMLGVALRAAFPHLFASGVSGYVSLRHIPDSIRLLYATAREMLSSGQGALKFLLLGGILFVTLAILVIALYSQSRPRRARKFATVEIFIVAFVSASSVSLVIGQVLTGSTTTRYLEPLFVFPLLTVVLIGVYVLRRLLVEVKSVELRRNLSRFMLGVASIGSVLIVIAGTAAIPTVVRAASGSGYDYYQCLDSFVGKSRINGVGSFWAVRPLAVYGSQKGEVLQIQDPLEVFPWMNNLGAYEGKTFSYVVVDSSGQVTAAGLAPLGAPARVISCPGYEIYDYQHTEGERILTQRIAASAELLLKDGK